MVFSHAIKRYYLLGGKDRVLFCSLTPFLNKRCTIQNSQALKQLLKIRDTGETDTAGQRTEAVGGVLPLHVGTPGKQLIALAQISPVSRKSLMIFPPFFRMFL